MSLLWPDLKEFCHSFINPLSPSPLYPVSPELRTSGCANMLIGCSGSQGVHDHNHMLYFHLRAFLVSSIHFCLMQKTFTVFLNCVESCLDVRETQWLRERQIWGQLAAPAF